MVEAEGSARDTGRAVVLMGPGVAAGATGRLVRWRDDGRGVVAIEGADGRVRHLVVPKKYLAFSEEPPATPG